MTTRTIVRSIAAIALTLALGACGGGADLSAPRHEPEPEAAEPTAPQGSASSLDDALVARSSTDLAVFARPGDPTPAQTLPATTEFGSARALLVDTDDGDWLRVLLPTRPNGSTGWIRRADVELRRVDEAIEIDLSARTLRLLVDGQVVVSTAVAIGTPDNPTPTGRFYVVDKLATGDPDHTYGPIALGLSGHSFELGEFAGGDGQIGIHGTNDPASIGQAASHGCIRVDNDVILQLADLVPLGAPVVID
jgi:lipoprotein-anchoring transpeptidase ErfK/SrfK